MTSERGWTPPLELGQDRTRPLAGLWKMEIAGGGEILPAALLEGH
jgi:hypothetical protein